MEVKLKDYLDGATVLFDAAGNVVDGCLQGDYSPWVAPCEGWDAHRSSATDKMSVVPVVRQDGGSPYGWFATNKGIGQR